MDKETEEPSLPSPRCAGERGFVSREFTMPQSFEEHFSHRVREVHARPLWARVSTPPFHAIDWEKAAPEEDEAELAPSLAVCGPEGAGDDGPAANGVRDLVACLQQCFDLTVSDPRIPSVGVEPSVRFILDPKDAARDANPAEAGFVLDAARGGITVSSGTETGLLRGSLYLSNLWRLRGAPFTPRGKREIRPRFSVRLSADLPGGFSTSPAWVDGREDDTNFLELARHGVNAIPIMTHLADYLRPQDAPAPYASLVHAEAQARRDRLAKLCRQGARYGVQFFLMGYNPKLALDAAVFDPARGGRAEARGAAQFNDTFRVLCWNDPPTGGFLANAWAGLCRDIPQLGGVMAINGGEGFYHCHMRSGGRSDCPRCHTGNAHESAAHLLNLTARAIRKANPHARLIGWPYSAAELWSNQRDQRSMIELLDPETVWFQTDIEKDQFVLKPAGYSKHLWDYSMDDVPVSDRAKSQRAICKQHGVEFGLKIETNVAWETTGLPFLPLFERQARQWKDALALNPAFLHTQWLSGGSTWGSPAEEIGYWAQWGRGTKYAEPIVALQGICKREYGPAGPAVIRASMMFGRAFSHHPGLAYYKGANFIGTGSPLPLDPDDLGDLDRAFFGVYYWMCEGERHEDSRSLVEPQPLFFTQPYYTAIVKEGPLAGLDVAVEEFRHVVKHWEPGVTLLRQAFRKTRPPHKKNVGQLADLAEHLAYVWTSAGNVEEWLRLRNAVVSQTYSPTPRYGLREVNKRCLARMEELMRDEARIARKDLALVREYPDWDISWHLDMCTRPLAEITAAKVEQVKGLLESEAWEKWKARCFEW